MSVSETGVPRVVFCEDQEMDARLMQSLLSALQAASERLQGRCAGGDRSLLCNLLNSLSAARPSFERLAEAFHAGTEGDASDQDVVRAMLRVRIDLDTALARRNDPVLDEFAASVDDELDPFEDAVLMLSLQRDEFEGTWLDPDRWWGVLGRGDERDQDNDVDLSLYLMWERAAAFRIAEATSTTTTKAARCLDMAKLHLKSLRVRLDDYSRRRRFDDHGWKAVPDNRWDSFGHPRPYAIEALAGRLARAPDSKLDRFERYTGLSRS